MAKGYQLSTKLEKRKIHSKLQLNPFLKLQLIPKYATTFAELNTHERNKNKTNYLSNSSDYSNQPQQTYQTMITNQSGYVAKHK